MKTLVLSIAIFANGIAAYSQAWSGIGHFNGPANLLAVDSVNDVLYIAGNFNRINNNLNVQGVCRYDGSGFSNVHIGANLNSFFNQFFTIQSMAFYNGELYIASSQIRQLGWIENFPINTLIMKYTGNEWVSVFPEFNSCYSLKVENGKLFMFGDAHSENGYIHFMGVYDGEELNVVPFSPPNPQMNGSYFGSIWDVLEVDSGYVLGGQLWQNIGLSSVYTSHVFYWDGESNEFSFFNDGIYTSDISNNDIQVRSLAMFNNKVYIGGMVFSSPDNCSGMGVAYAENGHWHSLSGNSDSGFNPPVNKLLVHHDELWIVGDLFHFNAEWQGTFYPLSSVAIWDGENVYRPSDDTFQFPGEIFDIVTYRDTIYVAGTFEFVNVTQTTSVARFTGINTSTKDYDLQSLRVFPNPSTQTVYVTSPDLTPGSFVRIYNLNGQLVYEQNLTEQSERVAIATANIGPPGMYVVQLFSPGKTVITQKLVIGRY
jgi:flagellar hook assembly protein FlgD